MITLISYGMRKGAKPIADRYVNAMVLQNPHSSKKLRGLTGLNRLVQDRVLKNPAAQAMVQDVVSDCCQHYHQDYVVAIGCGFGRHRSVVIVEEVARRLRFLVHTRIPGATGISVVVIHSSI